MSLGIISKISNFLKTMKSRDLRLAWTVAIAADAIQIVAMPLFAPGALSPADGILDIAVGAILIRLLGWHWAFLPAFAAEFMPGIDLLPTWTATVFYVTGHQMRTGEPEILPPAPAPARRP